MIPNNIYRLRTTPSLPPFSYSQYTVSANDTVPVACLRVFRKDGTVRQQSSSTLPTSDTPNKTRSSICRNQSKSSRFKCPLLPACHLFGTRPSGKARQAGRSDQAQTSKLDDFLHGDMTTLKPWSIRTHTQVDMYRAVTCWEH